MAYSKVLSKFVILWLDDFTLSLLKSWRRKSPLLVYDEYAGQGSEDSCFANYFGTIQSVVTSSGNNDSGMFETNLRDERFLSFEGAGAESTWRLELLSEFRQFDYNTISDVILHIRYTARQGGAQLREGAVGRIQELIEAADTSGPVQLFSLKHDFPTEWHQSVIGDQDFEATVKKEYFPYFVQGENIDLNRVELYAIQDEELAPATSAGINLNDLTNDLKKHDGFEISLVPDGTTLTREKEARVFLLFRYSIKPISSLN